MAKKPNPKAAAKLTVERYGDSVDQAIESFRLAKTLAKDASDDTAVETFKQCIAEAEKLRI